MHCTVVVILKIVRMVLVDANDIQSLLQILVAPRRGQVEDADGINKTKGTPRQSNRKKFREHMKQLVVRTARWQVPTTNII